MTYIKVTGLRETIRNYKTLYPEKVRKIMRSSTRSATVAGETYAKVAASSGRYATGELASTIHARKLGESRTNVRWAVLSTSPRIDAVEYDVSPHLIPNNPWKWTWRTAPLHPGNPDSKTKGFMRRTARRVEDVFRNRVVAEVKREFG